MNTKQIAEEAAEQMQAQCSTRCDSLETKAAIIQAAIEKATEPLYKLLDEQGARNWGISRAAHMSEEKK